MKVCTRPYACSFPSRRVVLCTRSTPGLHRVCRHTGKDRKATSMADYTSYCDACTGSSQCRVMVLKHSPAHLCFVFFLWWWVGTLKSQKIMVTKSSNSSSICNRIHHSKNEHSFGHNDIHFLDPCNLHRDIKGPIGVTLPLNL